MDYGSFEAACLVLSCLIGRVYDQGIVLIAESNDLYYGRRKI